MDGTDFYDLARSLGQGALPAERRTATSRAYYGAYHTAYELLSSIGVTLPRGLNVTRRFGKFLIIRAIRTSLRPAANFHPCEPPAIRPTTI